MILVEFEDVRQMYKDLARESHSLYKYERFFPIVASAALAGVVADLMGDGHLQYGRHWRFDFTSKYTNELRRFELVLFKLFNIKGKIRQCYGNNFSTSYNYGVNNTILARALFLCGVPAGAKVSTKFRVPKWILNDEKFFRVFVRRLYACEGYVWGGSSLGIGIEMWKKIHLKKSGTAFLDDLRNGLWKFYKIKATRVFTRKCISENKDGDTMPLKFYIKRKDSIRKFYERVGFDHAEKQYKLGKVIEHMGV